MRTAGRVLQMLQVWARRAAQDFVMAHVPDRCQACGCDCPCGWCMFDRRHVRGGPVR